MYDTCKTHQENAEALENDNPNTALELYKKAARCFIKSNDTKQASKCLEKAVKILKSIEVGDNDALQFLEKYKDVSEIYKLMGKQSESEKLMKSLYKSLVDNVKTIRVEVKGIEDPYASEKKLKLAAAYAKAANDDLLRNACWVDMGDKFREKAAKITNPRQAVELFVQAAHRYSKGENEKLQNDMYLEAAINFVKRGNQVEKSKKDLILAIDNYQQAAFLYEWVNNSKERELMSKKIEELCEIIGIPKEHIFDYLEKELGLYRVILDLVQT